MLTTVRQGSVLAPGLTAVTGILVPDTTAPSFTKTAVKVPATPNAVTGDWTVQLDLGLNEHGKVYFAVYGDPSCITGQRKVHFTNLGNVSAILLTLATLVQQST